MALSGLTLENPAHERFCRLIVGGFSPIEAYEYVYNRRDELLATSLVFQPQIRQRLLDLTEDDINLRDMVKKHFSVRRRQKYVRTRKPKARRILSTYR